MRRLIDIFVPGKAVAKGSKTAFYAKALGRAMVVESNAKRQKPWASRISFNAKSAMSGAPVTCAVSVGLVFTIHRPKSHYRTGRNAALLRSSAPPYPTCKPDLDKLTRCALDALTGIVYHDDSQVCWQLISKRYGAAEGVEIVVEAQDKEATG